MSPALDQPSASADNASSPPAKLWADAHITPHHRLTSAADELFEEISENPVATAFAFAAIAVHPIGIARLKYFDRVAAFTGKEAEPIVHLTSAAAASAIGETAKIGGRYGIFAVKAGRVPDSQLLRAAATLVTTDLSAEIRIDGQAAAAFKSPLPVGPFSLARRLAGVTSTPLGSIDLGESKFIPDEIFSKGVFRPATGAEISRYKIHQYLLDTAVDSELYAAGAFGAADISAAKKLREMQKQNAEWARVHTDPGT
ncbi:MAG TPA: hypothetical protein V6C81_19530 [Planktothrix sp.]|jgi:hypothetical protein